MNPKDYLMDELWPLLDDEQKKRLVFLASLMAQLPPESDNADTDTDNQGDTDSD